MNPTMTTATSTAPIAANRPTRLTERISPLVSRLPCRLRPSRMANIPYRRGKSNIEACQVRWLLALRLLVARPGSGEFFEATTRSTVRCGLGCAENRALQRGRCNQLAPGGAADRSVGRLLLVD